MKIYIASSFSLINMINEVCKVLESKGHIIPIKWWHRKDLKEKFALLEPDDFYNEYECKYAFDRDFDGVKNCDILIFIADYVKIKPYTGASVEIGIAFALNKPVYSLGIFKNSAMYYPIIRCKTLNELIKKIEGDIK